MILNYRGFNKYVVLDLETTGLSSEWDEIIEIAYIVIENGEVVNEFSTLINPEYEINDFITSLTGITNEMLINAPKIEEIITKVVDDIKHYELVGHNINFDINFIKSKTDKLNYNDIIYCDTMLLARRLLKNLKHHRLSDLINYFEISVKEKHRALADVHATNEAYKKLVNLIPPEGLLTGYQRGKVAYNLKNIIADENQKDKDNIFYGKYCVFTGVLDNMLRKDAAQLIANIGGFPENGVTKNTNYLILGSNDYCKSIKDGKSKKQKKAEMLKLQGQDIQIITEIEFYSCFDLEFVKV